ncbi:MAG: endonuclease/exonuclease/phosphatase family protein [Persicimonas sp.]
MSPSQPPNEPPSESPNAPPKRAYDELRVVTYNIHSCIGTDGQRDPERVGRVLCGLEPDIVALQEVNTALNQRVELGQLAVLARMTGLEPVVGPVIEREYGFYGNAILSRFPAAHVRRLDLSVEGFEPRGALDVDLDVGGERVRVVATHLGLATSERRTQIGRLLSTLYRNPRGHAAIVLGDFNEWFGWSRNLRRLNSYLGWQPRRATYPSQCPVLALDRIWVAPKLLLRDAGVDNGELARVASDHLPLWADMRLAAWPQHG